MVAVLNHTTAARKQIARHSRQQSGFVIIASRHKARLVHQHRFAATDSMSKLPRHVRENRQYWDDMAADWVAAGEQAWAHPVPTWGQWGVSDDQCPMLPDDMSGMRAIELGCGTGYIAAWMTRRGARVSAIDNSERQLETARRLAREYQLAIDFLHGNAENVPVPDGTFDFAVSEYGAAIWCDPEAWIPEAHRLLKPGGKLVFLGNSPLSMICMPLDGSPVDGALHRDYFTRGTLDWTEVEIDPGGIEFNRPLSAWFDLFRRVGFRVDDYREPAAPATASGIEHSVPAKWAQTYPSEQVWILTRL